MRSLVFYLPQKAAGGRMDILISSLIIFLALISFGFIVLCDKVQ